MSPRGTFATNEFGNRTSGSGVLPVYLERDPDAGAIDAQETALSSLR